jgi:hypothetical protein
MYVQMTDKFMSGWGKAKSKKNILVFKCETDKDIEAVLSNAEPRDEMVDIKVRATPLKGRQKCLVQQKNKKVYPNWYKKDYFKNRSKL